LDIRQKTAHHHPNNEVHTMSTEIDVPYLDISDPAFAMHSDAVREARERHWFAKTNYGFAVLRHDYESTLLKDTRLSQGSGKWPDHNGEVHDLRSCTSSQADPKGKSSDRLR
jgi:hypothetical protein